MKWRCNFSTQKNFYIYVKSGRLKNNLVLIYWADSISYVSQLLGFEISWIKIILYRNKGWYKNKLYFSLIPLETSDLILELIPDIKELKESGIIYRVSDNLKDVTKVKLYITKLLKKWEGILVNKGKMVRVTNVKSKEINLYRSKREAGRYLKVDYSSFYNRDKDKLFRGMYKIEILE